MAKFELIAFDADDTLWTNESLYQMGRQRFEALLARYEVQEDLNAKVDATEVRNLRCYGYGVVSFILSLIEAGIELTGGRITGEDVMVLIALSKEMLAADVGLFEHAEDAVAELSASYPLMLITKGDLLHQRSKIKRSGLADHFEHVEVVSEKSVATYEEILSRHSIDPQRFLMIGNSMRSDVLPVLELGGWAVYIPNELTWSHENADPPVERGHRCLEVEHLGLLAERIRELEEGFLGA